jgi:hypothetical protein
MSSFGRSTDPRRPLAPRNSGDYVPLLPMQHGSRNLNIWGADNQDNDLLVGSQGEKHSTKTLLRHSEDEMALSDSAVFLQLLYKLRIGQDKYGRID